MPTESLDAFPFSISRVNGLPGGICEVNRGVSAKRGGEMNRDKQKPLFYEKKCMLLQNGIIEKTHLPDIF